MSISMRERKRTVSSRKDWSPAFNAIVSAPGSKCGNLASIHRSFAPSSAHLLNLEVAAFMDVKVNNVYIYVYVFQDKSQAFFQAFLLNADILSILPKL